MARRILRYGLFAGTLTVAGGIGAAAVVLRDPEPVQAVVHLQATAFQPANVSVAKGGTVRWVNDLDVPHNVTPNDANQPGAWSPAEIAGKKGASFSHTFNTPGAFPYSCTIHPGMTGRVTVK